FFMELSTRKVQIAGIASSANGLWMSQIGRNLTDAVDGVLKGKRYLIPDRDPLFTEEFLDLLDKVGVKSVKLPPRSPNLNAHAERFVRSIKESCLERMILFGENSLRTAIQNFVAHYHSERNQASPVCTTEGAVVEGGGDPAPRLAVVAQPPDLGKELLLGGSRLKVLAVARQPKAERNVSNSFALAPFVAEGVSGCAHQLVSSFRFAGVRRILSTESLATAASCSLAPNRRRPDS
ncbi:MAG TPA: integrase core domain-containing protein, partial [Bryobacteraceae bacterium]